MLLLAIFTVTWTIACLACDRVLRKAMLVRLGGDLSSEYGAALRFLEWTSGKSRVLRPNPFRILIAPFELSLVYGREEEVAKYFRTHVTEVIAEARDARISRWQRGGVWFHPVEADQWRALYSQWHHNRFADAYKDVQKHARFGNAMKVSRLMRTSIPCTCADPRRVRFQAEVAFCKEDHVLPVDAVLVFLG